MLKIQTKTTQDGSDTTEGLRERYSSKSTAYTQDTCELEIIDRYH
jgi:hypothetical protein